MSNDANIRTKYILVRNACSFQAFRTSMYFVRIFALFDTSKSLFFYYETDLFFFNLWVLQHQTDHQLYCETGETTSETTNTMRDHLTRISFFCTPDASAVLYCINDFQPFNFFVVMFFFLINFAIFLSHPATVSIISRKRRTRIGTDTSTR